MRENLNCGIANPYIPKRADYKSARTSEKCLADGGRATARPYMQAQLSEGKSSPCRDAPWRVRVCSKVIVEKNATRMADAPRRVPTCRLAK